MTDSYKEIQPGVFWIGTEFSTAELRHNSYIIADKNDYILIDIAPYQDFNQFIEIILQIINKGNLTHIILQNLSPNICLSLILLNHQFDATIVLDKRADMWLKNLEIKNPKYFIDDNNFKLKLNSGREINFIETPYLPYFEGFITYDKTSQFLFSSFLFSARPLRWKLFADKVFYKESMKSFHELHIPGNKFLGPVMEMILKLKDYPGIKFIASSHGSILNDDLEVFIHILKNLECGIAINPIVNDITRKEGYISLCNQILAKYSEHFSKNEILEIFENSNIQIDRLTGKIKTYNGSGEELWEKLFTTIYTKKGSRWLSVGFNMVIYFVKEYHVSKPSVFNDKEQEIIRIDEENRRLKIEIQHLEVNLEKTTENITKDKITKLFNEFFLRDFLRNIIYTDETKIPSFILLIFEIDNVWRIKKKYGKQGDEKIIKIIQILTDILKIEAAEKNYQLFKMSSEGAFVFYIQNDTLENVIYFSEKVRNDVSGSARFQEDITVSCGIVSSDDFGEERINENLILLIAFTRLGMAKSKGTNQICYTSEIQKVLKKTVLIVETDSIYINLIKSTLDLFDLNIISCEDGFMAMKIIEKDKPDLVISELMLTKENGLTVRERMLQVSSNQNIPFILISHLKDEETVRRACNLKVNYYLKKPLLMAEVQGIVKNILYK